MISESKKEESEKRKRKERPPKKETPRIEGFSHMISR